MENSRVEDPEQDEGQEDRVKHPLGATFEFPTAVHAFVRHMKETVRYYKHHFGEEVSEDGKTRRVMISNADKRAEDALEKYAKIVEGTDPHTDPASFAKFHTDMFLDVFEPHKFMFVGIVRKLREFLLGLDEGGFSDWATRSGPQRGPGLELGTNFGRPVGLCVPVGAVTRMAEQLYKRHERLLVSKKEGVSPRDPEHVLIYCLCLDILGLVEGTMAGQDRVDCVSTVAYFTREYILYEDEEAETLQERMGVVRNLMTGIDMKGIAESFGVEMPEGIDTGELVDTILGGDAVTDIGDAIRNGGSLEKVLADAAGQLKDKFEGQFSPEYVEYDDYDSDADEIEYEEVLVPEDDVD